MTAGGGAGIEPDKLFPSTAANAMPGGLAGFANTTEIDLKNQQTNNVTGAFGGLTQACSTAQNTPVVGSLAQVGPQNQNNQNQPANASSIFSGLQYLSDFLCSTATGTQSTGTTAQSVMGGVSGATNAVQSTPFVAGLISLGNPASTANGGQVAQGMSGAQNLFDFLCGAVTGTPSTGSTPSTLMNGVTSVVGAAQGNDLLSSVAQSANTGQTNNQIVNVLQGLNTTNIFAPVTNAITSAVSSQPPSETAPQAPITQITSALNNIPNSNVVGLGGPPTAGSTIQATWDAMWQALTGSSGTGNSLGNLSSAASAVANTASNGVTLGQTNSVYIANRSVSKPGYGAVDATADAVFPISQISGTTVTTVNVTASATVIGFIATPDAGIKQSVVWLGQNTANITSLILNLYQMNTSTGVMTWMFSSPNIIGNVSNALSWNYYALPSANYVHSAQGNVYAVEMVVAGTGTYQVAGIPNHWLPANPQVFPQQLAASRSLSVAEDGVGTGYTTTGDASTVNASFSYTATAGDAVIVAVTVQSTSSGGHGSFTRAATYGGSSMTSLGVVDANAGTAGWVELFGILNVSGGAQTVAATVTGGSPTFECVAVDCVSYTGVGSFGTAVTNSGNGTAASSGSVTSATGQMVVQAFVGVGIGSAFAETLSSYNQTSRYSQALVSTVNSSNSMAMIMGDAAGASSVSFTATVNQVSPWGSVAVPLVPGTVTAPTTLSPVYSANVPWFGLSGAASRTTMAPATQEFSTHGSYTYTIPSWLQSGDHIDIIAVGAGNGGQAGLSTSYGLSYGGLGGSWTTKTLQYGIDFPVSTTTITGTVGAGGNGGLTNGANGAAGGNTTATVTGYSGGMISAAGANGESTAGNTTNTTAGYGVSPGNQTYQNNTYTGGLTQTVAGSNGNSPGGGGAAGALGGFFAPIAGGAGSDGAIWFVARQG